MAGRAAGETESRRQVWRRGRRAEWLAAWWLRLKGYRIQARNFRAGGGEVDLLARRGDALVAVEVKWRPGRRQAAEAVSARQKHRLGRAARLFWARQPDADRITLRFDVILMAPWSLPHHIENAWTPER